MNHRALALRYLLFTLLSCAAPTFAAEAEKPRPSPLAAVAALDKPVTYTETKIPLGELVEKVAADTGVKLVALPSVADEPVSVGVKDLPARQLLDQLASLLDYFWTSKTPNPEPPTPNAEHRTPTFELTQDVAAKQREEKQRSDWLAAADQRFRDAIRQRLELADWPQEKIQSALAAAQRREQELAKLPLEQRQALANSPAERESEQRPNLLRELAEPLTRAKVRAVGLLTPAQWATLRQGDPLILSTDPSPGEERLPAEIACAFRAAPLETRLPGFGPGVPAEVEARFRQEEKDRQAAWQAATGYRVRLTPAFGYFKSNGSQILNIHVEPLSGAQPAQVAGSGYPFSVAAGAPDSREAYDWLTPERRAELNRDPVLGLRKSFKPETRPRPELPGESPRLRWRLRDLLPDLARVYGVQFLADAYGEGPEVTPEELATDSTPALWEILNRYAGLTHRFERREKAVWLRSRRWFLDRPREIPLRLVRRWRAMLDQYGALPLEEVLWLVTDLSDEQLQDLESVCRNAGLPFLASDLQPLTMPYGPAVLRLYVALSPGQTQPLWQGKPLPAARMSSQQRRLFLAAARVLNRHRGIPFDPEQAAAGAFSLTGSPRLRVQTPEDAPGSYRLEDAPAAARPDSGGSPSGAPETPPSAPPAGAGPARATPRPVTWVTFDLTYGPEMTDSVSLIIAPRA